MIQADQLRDSDPLVRVEVSVLFCPLGNGGVKEVETRVIGEAAVCS